MKTFLATLAGVVAAVVALAALGLGIGALVTRPEPIVEGSQLHLVVDGTLTEYDLASGPVPFLGGGDVPTLQRLLDALAMAAVDDRIERVVLEVSPGTAVGRGMTQELHAALAAVRAAGKPVVGYATGFDAASYWLLSGCDEVVVPPAAYLSFFGFASTSDHVPGLLEKLGIRPEVHRIREYKAAAELVTRDGMSDEARENRQWVLDDFWSVYVRDLTARRGLDEARIEALMARIFFTPEEAREAGLVDRVRHWDELEAEWRGEREALPRVALGRYLEEDAEELGLGGGDDTIAVVHAQGTLSGRESGVDPLLGPNIGYETVIRDLRAAQRDEAVVAVVLRVDSPGGDALTSGLIGREVARLAAEKPVVVSMVDVAASGGYQIAFRATHLMADETTLTGSIGSIRGVFDLSGLYERLGVATDAVTRGPNALILSPTHAMTAEQRKRFEEDHWASFDAWLREVADARGVSFERAETLAHGRVFTGRQAVENGLIDSTGSYADALAKARELAGLAPDAPVNVTHHPEPRPLLQQLLGGSEEPVALAAWRWRRALEERVRRSQHTRWAFADAP